MYKLCKTEGSTQRQKEIEQILLGLMREKSYDEISVTEICERANMPRKSFYRYFDGKEGAMQSLLYHTMSEFNNVRLDSGIGKISEEFEELFNFWKNKKEFLDAFEKSGLLGLLIESAVSFSMSEFGDVEKYRKSTDSPCPPLTRTESSYALKPAEMVLSEKTSLRMQSLSWVSLSP